MMNYPDIAMNKQKFGKAIPKYLFVISCSLVSFQNLLSSNFSILNFPVKIQISKSSIMSSTETLTYDTTLKYILKPYMISYNSRYKVRSNNLSSS